MLADGRKEAVRYAGWTKRDYGTFRTYAYGDTRSEPQVTKATPPPGVTGDAKRGRALFLARDKGPCTGCHLVPGDDVWPAGNVGPDLSTLADRKLTVDYLYQLVYDARVIFPNTVMPPWGTTKVFTPAQIVDVVAYLQTLKGPRSPEKNTERDPATRPKPVGFGDNLDPTNNPAVVIGEDAEALWKATGPSGKSCASCHEGGAARAMRGVATRYPKFVGAWGRVMSVEDFLSVHGPATTGQPLPGESDANLALTLLIKMASNGMPVAVDLASPAARAALARGKATFERRVGERNHACADCHTEGKGAGKFLGGRLLANVTDGPTRHFPTWRTSQAAPWDMRKRFQWCMTPLGMNMLAADSVEYAELELYLTSFDVGRPLTVPGIRH
ncbi:MAG: sulfur oxidation c-type cytochrome SoxA [Candidatus Rokubacteria bacterium]|nr:sulfur oxidation c-type cytochrome SoxA [Candidatus Rokubacteria bacterium]